MTLLALMTCRMAFWNLSLADSFLDLLMALGDECWIGFSGSGSLFCSGVVVKTSSFRLLFCDIFKVYTIIYT